MKVQNITDIDKFFKVIDSCKGKVELVTGEGDRLNLKSKLSQYVSMANIFSSGEIPELEIVAYEKEDIDKLINFMLSGNME
ncbi:MAG: polya polymerase [Lachnospiraceae bacterium]|nr:polya polymerase [Robinsoniella sp.]MDY3767162.1 polya polymerase [Lachnospiraceae bacterium]